MNKNESIRSIGGNQGRICYDPDWSQSKPFCTYFQGTANNAFATLNQAKASLIAKGCKFSPIDEWK